MTIDEAIERAKYKVEKAEEEFKFVTLEYQMDNNNDENLAKRYGNCKRYFKECKQLAEWLEELKQLRVNGRIQEEALTDAYLLGKYDGIKQGRAEVIKDIKQSFHNIYSANLYCQEDMAESCKTEGCNCDDCLYVMFNKFLAEQLKEKKNG